MNKSPAFQFYPKDFLMDDKVAVMNMEARGVYITLLSYCWNNNGLPNDQEELKQMCGHPKNWEKIWKKVGKCFYAKGGSNKTKGGSRVVEPKGNHSVSSSSSPIIKEVCSEKYSELAILLESKIKERLPRYKFTGKQYLKEWANEFRIMEEGKEATVEEIKEIIIWVSKDDFWYRNIKSAVKLRKQLGVLWDQMKSDKKKRRIQTPEEINATQKKALEGK